MAKDQAEAKSIAVGWNDWLKQNMPTRGRTISGYQLGLTTDGLITGLLAKTLPKPVKLDSDVEMHPHIFSGLGQDWLQWDLRVSYPLGAEWTSGRIPLPAWAQTPAPASQLIVPPAPSSPQPAASMVVSTSYVTYTKPGYQATINFPPAQPKSSGPPCPKCGGPTTLLFIHSVCDVCEPPGGQPASAPDRGGYRGFVVWRDKPDGSHEYVYQTKKCADKWRIAAGLERFPIREVTSPLKFEWRDSTGTVPGIQLSTILHPVYRHGAEPRDRSEHNVFLTEA